MSIVTRKSFWADDQFKSLRITTGNDWKNYYPPTSKSSHLLEVRSKNLVDNLKLLFGANDEFTVHELGCNVGRNLFYVKQAFTNCTISGNDVNAEAIENGKKLYKIEALEVYDTVDFVQFAEKEKFIFDCVVTMAHFMHLSQDEMFLFVKLLPKICKTLICYESVPNSPFDPTKYTVLKDRLFLHPYCEKEYLNKPDNIYINPVSGVNRLMIWRFSR